jgi:phage virion morphogenesis protein
MALALSITDEAGPALRGLLGALRDLRPAMAAISGIAQASTRRRFDDGKGPDGVAWKPLAASTLAAKAAAGKTNPKILVDHALLKRGIQRKYSSSQAEVGSNLVYAAIHQLGGQAGRGGTVEIPARPFLGLSDADRTDMLEVLASHLNSAVRS